MKKPVKKSMGGKMPKPSPVSGGMSRPAMPGKNPIQMGPGFPGGKPIPVPAKPGMPMRRAKGGSVKKADGGPIKTRISNLRERAANIRENVGDRFPQKDYDMSRIRAGVRNRMGLKKGGMAKGKKK